MSFGHTDNRVSHERFQKPVIKAKTCIVMCNKEDLARLQGRGVLLFMPVSLLASSMSRLAPSASHDRTDGHGAMSYY